VGSGVALALGSLRVVWDADALRSLETAAESPPWRLDGEVDWSANEALRVVSAGFEDGAVLAVAALRPAGAAGHDADTVAGVLVEPDGSDRAMHEVLISTETGPDGRVRRVGLELYEEEELMPLRVAADGDGLMEFRLEGRRGHGRFDLLQGS
jgi:hypothetical protein